jgi:hypothetical protein
MHLPFLKSAITRSKGNKLQKIKMPKIVKERLNFQKFCITFALLKRSKDFLLAF